MTPRSLALLTILAATPACGNDVPPPAPKPSAPAWKMEPKITCAGTTVSVEIPGVKEADVTVLGRHEVARDDPYGDPKVYLAKLSMTLDTNTLKVGKQTLTFDIANRPAYGGDPIKVQATCELDYRPPPGLRWTWNGDYHATPILANVRDMFGDHTAGGTIDGDSAAFVVTGPEGTGFKVGDSAYEITGGTATVRIPLAALAADVDPRKIADNATLQLDLPVVYDSGAGGRFLLSGVTFIGPFLAHATEAPVLFPGESAGSGGHASLLILGGGLYGKADKLRDVDLVGLRRPRTTKLSPCRYSGNFSADREVTTVTAIIVERRTGKVVAKKEFASKDSTACPRTVSAAPNSGSSWSWHPDDGVVESWMKAQAPGLEPAPPAPASPSTASAISPI